MTTTEPEPTAADLAGMEWWNSIDEDERAYWLAEANTAIAAEAWAEYQRRPRYTVTQRPEALGGGWSLKLYLGDVEMGGGVSPPDAEAESPEQALIWAYNDAAEAGDEWVQSRQE